MVRVVSARVLLLGLLLAACTPPAFAQGGRAEIAGIVLDQGKAVLPGVTVTATSEGTGQNRQAVTGSEGKFVIPTLLPGTYTIKAELQGFQPTTRKGVVLQVGQEMTVKPDDEPGRRVRDHHRHGRESRDRDDGHQDRHQHHRVGNR